jgi:hypothetical protein
MIAGTHASHWLSLREELINHYQDPCYSAAFHGCGCCSQLWFSLDMETRLRNMIRPPGGASHRGHARKGKCSEKLAHGEDIPTRHCSHGGMQYLACPWLDFGPLNRRDRSPGSTLLKDKPRCLAEECVDRIFLDLEDISSDTLQVSCGVQIRKLAARRCCTSKGDECGDRRATKARMDHPGLILIRPHRE